MRKRWSSRFLTAVLLLTMIVSPLIGADAASGPSARSEAVGTGGSGSNPAMAASKKKESATEKPADETEKEAKKKKETEKPTEEATKKPKKTKQPEETTPAPETPTKKPKKTTEKPTEEPTQTPTPEAEWEIQGDVLVACRSQEKKITVPEGIREIGEKAFEGLSRLETVKLPDSVEIIGDRAFANCKRLKKVILGEKSRLKKIGKRAFLNCVKLDVSFVPSGAKVASSAFEGIPSQGEPTEEPTEKPSDEPTKAPSEEPTKKPEDEPTEKPSEEPTEDPSDEPTEDPWEEPDPGPIYWGGGGSRQPHSRNTVPLGPDYDLIAIPKSRSGNETEEGEAEKEEGETAEEAPVAMSQLTLGGETLELSLARGDDTPGFFMVRAMNWREAAWAPEAQEAEPETRTNVFRDGDDEQAADTLLLTEVEPAPEGSVWTLNGALLRRMNRSGIAYLALQSGEQIVSLETEGILAGWAYDEMKREGAGSRWFEFTIFLKEGEEPAWQVTVEDQAYSLTADDHAGLYLTGVWESNFDE